MVCRAMIALMLLRRARTEDAPAAMEHLKWSLDAARARGLREASQIEGILQRLGG